MSVKVFTSGHESPEAQTQWFASTQSFGSWVNRFVDELNVYTQTTRDQKVVFPSCRIIEVPSSHPRRLGQATPSSTAPAQDSIVYALEIASPSVLEKNGGEIVEEIIDQISAHLAVAQLMSDERASTLENSTPMVEILRRGPTESVRVGSGVIHRVVMTVKAFPKAAPSNDEERPESSTRLPWDRFARAESDHRENR